MTLGKRIKAARERIKPKMTQGALGSHFDVSDKAVSQWERDETIPEVEKLGKLARTLKVPADWLLEGKGPPPDVRPPASALEQLNPDERAVVEAIAQTLIQRRGSAA